MCGKDFNHFSSKFFNANVETNSESVFLGRGSLKVTVISDDRSQSQFLSEQIGKRMSTSPMVAEAVAQQEVKRANEQGRPFHCCIQLN